MQKGLLIKKLLAETVEKILIKESIQDITVNDIVIEAGVSRTTFYRYFKDKYDLINYIYTQYIDELSAKYKYVDEPYKMTIELLKYFQEKRELFLKIFGYMGQNSFTEFFINSLSGYDEALIKEVLDVEEIPREDRYMIQYNAMGWTTVIYNWLLDGCIETPREVMQLLSEFTPNRLLHYYLNAGKKTE